MQERLNAANELVKEIAHSGRQFFMGKDGNMGRLSLDIESGVPIWHDEYTGEQIRLEHALTGRGWFVRLRGFSHGSSLSEFVTYLGAYVAVGQQLSCDFFTAGGGRHWAYPEADARNLDAVAIGLGVCAAPVESEPEGQTDSADLADTADKQRQRP